MHPLQHFVEQYGLWAIFLGCVAEGESVAVLGGYLAHQGFFDVVTVFAATFAGAFLGDTGFYLAGRFFASTKWVQSLIKGPGFDQMLDLVRTHPGKFVILNRYAYGFRVAGGVASGLSGISAPKFIALNALSSLLWALIFNAIGYFFGLGLEQLLGAALHKHHRLLIALGVAAALALIGALIARHHQMRSSPRPGFRHESPRPKSPADR